MTAIDIWTKNSMLHTHQEDKGVLSLCERLNVGMRQKDILWNMQHVCKIYNAIWKLKNEYVAYEDTYKCMIVYSV